MPRQATLQGRGSPPEALRGRSLRLKRQRHHPEDELVAAVASSLRLPARDPMAHGTSSFSVLDHRAGLLPFRRGIVHSIAFDRGSIRSAALRAALLCAVCVLLPCRSGAAAQALKAPPEGQTEVAVAPTSRMPFASSALSADPNSYNFGFEYRGSVRGHFSDFFSLVGTPREPGYNLAVTPFVELHEPKHSSNVLPSQYWRARLAIAQSFGIPLRQHLLRVHWLLSHESDHETAHKYSKPGFLALNDLALGVSFLGQRGIWAVQSALLANWFFLSCTEPSRSCRNFRGDASAGGQMELTVATPRFVLWRFVPFASAFASGIVPHGLVHTEGRFSARLGAYVPFSTSVLSLYLSGWSGNDVGITRNQHRQVIGIGAAFAR